MRVAIALQGIGEWPMNKGRQPVATCWFCETQPADKAYSVELSIPREAIGSKEKKARQQRRSRESIIITIPRCAKCALVHKKSEKARLLGGVLVVVAIGVGLVSNWLLPEPGIWPTVIAIAGGLIGYVIGVGISVRVLRKAKGVKSEDSKYRYPPAIEMVSRAQKPLKK